MVDGRFEKVEGTDRELPADLVFLAMGFVGPGEGRVARAARRRASTSAATSPATQRYMTNVPGVFVAGDMGRGQSLIVWAIAEGRSCAAGVDAWLMGETQLPSPIPPTARPLALTSACARRCDAAAGCLGCGEFGRRLVGHAFSSDRRRPGPRGGRRPRRVRQRLERHVEQLHHLAAHPDQLRHDPHGPGHHHDHRRPGAGRVDRR